MDAKFNNAIEFHGLICRISSPRQMLERDRKQRVEVIVYVYLPEESRAVYSKRYRKPTEAEAMAVAESNLERMILESRNQIVEEIQCQKYDISLSTYYWLSRDKIRRMSRHENAIRDYDELSENADFKKVKLRQPLALDEVKAIFPGTTDKNTKLRRNLVCLFDDLYAQAARDKLYTENLYVREAQRRQRSESQKASSVMNRRIFGQQELTLYTADLISRVNEGSVIAGAQLLRALVGIKRDELCGLDRANWLRCEMYGVSWLVIEKVYYQKKGSPAELRYKLSRVAQYRCIPCTPLMEWALAKICQAGDATIPALFAINSQRLTPEELRLSTDRSLDEFLEHGGALALPGRKRFGRNDDRQITAGDFQRANIDFYLRNEIEMPESWKEVILGRGGNLETYAECYVNWNNPAVLKIMAKRLAQWHELILCAIEEKTDEFPLTRTAGYNYIIETMEPMQLRVQTQHGATVIVRRLERNNEERQSDRDIEKEAQGCE